MKSCFWLLLVCQVTKQTPNSKCLITLDPELQLNIGLNFAVWFTNWFYTLILVLQAGSTVWFYSLVLQSGSTVWFYSLVLQSGSTVWIWFYGSNKIQFIAPFYVSLDDFFSYLTFLLWYIVFLHIVQHIEEDCDGIHDAQTVVEMKGVARTLSENKSPIIHLSKFTLIKINFNRM